MLNPSDGVIKFECRFTEQALAVPANFDSLRCARKELHAKNLVGVGADGIGFGNVSIRCRNGFVITGSQTGLFDDPGIEAYALVHAWSSAENWLACTGLTKASSESLTHAAIYETSSCIGAVVHVHNHKRWMQWTANALRTNEDVPYGTPAMARELKRVIHEQKLGAAGLICMGGHPDGLVCWAPTIEEAAWIVLAANC